MLKRLLLGLCFIASTAISAHAETIHYEIYRMEDNKPPTLVASGNRTYSDKDFKLQKVKENTWNKLLELEQGFQIGIIDPQTPQGITLAAQKDQGNLSAEGFKLTAPGQYTKLEEIGSLKATRRNNGAIQEVSHITFDTDVSLRIHTKQPTQTPATAQANTPKPPNTTQVSPEELKTSYRILIKQGSVLQLPPSPNKSIE